MGAPLKLAMTACLTAARFELDLHRLALHYLSVSDLNLTRIDYSRNLSSFSDHQEVIVSVHSYLLSKAMR